MPAAMPLVPAPLAYPVIQLAARDSLPAFHDPAVHALARDSQPAMVDALHALPTPPLGSRKRLVAIAAASAACLAAVAVIVAVASGGSHTAAPASPVAAEKAAPKSTAPAPATSTPVAAVAPSVASAEPVVAAPVVPPPARAVPARRRFVAKPVVVDYDKAPATATPASDGDALAKARADYTAGNQHLFAGEDAAAVAAYQSAIAAYPNYAAGFRGLGLAYTASGQRADALKAFIRYVALAPTAHDVALIKKRSVALSRR